MSESATAVVDAFNSLYPVGSVCPVRTVNREPREFIKRKVRGPAYDMHGQPVAFFEGISGCVSVVPGFVDYAPALEEKNGTADDGLLYAQALYRMDTFVDLMMNLDLTEGSLKHLRVEINRLRADQRALVNLLVAKNVFTQQEWERAARTAMQIEAQRYEDEYQLKEEQRSGREIL